MAESAKKAKKKRGMPTSFTILFACLVLVALCTWIVAAFTPDVTGATLAQVMQAPFEGFKNAIDVCLFVIVLGGFLAIVNKTGALDAGVAALVRKLGDRDVLLIPVLMILFGVCGSTYGMMEETIPFYILLASVTFAMGFDSMVGALIVLLGAGLGTLGSTVNPFSVAIASAALTDKGIAVNQGIVIPVGFLLFVISEVMGIVFVMRYAKRVKADRSASAMTTDELAAMERAYSGETDDATDLAGARLTGKQKLVLALFALSFVVMIVAFIPWESFGIDVFTLGATPDNPGTAWSAILTGLPLGEWYFTECGIWFFVVSIVIGLVGGLSEKELVNTFVDGASTMISTALVIAVARAISVLMTQTGLDVFVLEAAASALSGVSAVVFAPASYALYFVLSFLIPSSSGMATVSMPIMGPLADSLHFSSEIMIMIYVAAHGVVAMIAPTNGVIVSGLELARTSYTSFLKLTAKFFVVLTVVTAAVLTVLMLVL
ncbi:YfcC family protein [Collinsella sp. An2]|uniref:YfcC family protein n=1 Tax=Collinsella sp. An2 TaxID=1965585 RepID=UPI000B3A5E35|nr:YfcC family protein [Collinsella sp. An2]OUP10401.1 C4-dicarboxylate ABC transporter [Collinsella sp. An2]